MIPLSKKTKDKIAEYSVYIGIFLVVAFIFFRPILVNVYEQIKYDNETITNKEILEFQEWDDKQQKTKQENEKAGS